MPRYLVGSVALKQLEVEQWPTFEPEQRSGIQPALHIELHRRKRVCQTCYDMEFRVVPPVAGACCAECGLPYKPERYQVDLCSGSSNWPEPLE